MWALRPLTQRSEPVVEVPVSFPNQAARKAFLYDLIDAAGMRTRATNIETLKKKGEDALQFCVAAQHYAAKQHPQGIAWSFVVLKSGKKRVVPTLYN